MARPSSLNLVVAFIIFGLVSCSEDDLPTAPGTAQDQSAPEFAIRDARHGGNPHFYFLPPLVPAPHPTGTFDPSLNPIISVCRLPDCATEIVRFTRGSGAEKVTLSRSDQAYQVNWHTKTAGLAVGTRFRVRVLVSGQLLGFLDMEVISRGGRPPKLPEGLLPVRQNHPVLIRFRIEHGALVEPPKQPKLAFVSDRDNDTFIEKIYVMNADGSDVVKLTDGEDSDPAWSPDGREIAFVRNVGTINFLPNVYLMNADGTGQTSLTAHPGSNPQWSPDGKQIAFTGFQNDAEIYVINADGSGLRNLTNDPALDEAPTWSPDGTKIAFVRGFVTSVNGLQLFNSEVFVMNSDGTDQRRLTNDPKIDVSPAWAPDGSKLAFSRTFAEGSAPFKGNIWLMNPDGSGQVNITNLPDQDAEDPKWSPAGDRITFTSDNPESISEIYAVNPDGTGLVNLTNTTDEGEFGALWSPDGSKIAFGGLRNNAFEIFVMNPDGTGRTNLTNNAAEDLDWAWKP